MGLFLSTYNSEPSDSRDPWFDLFPRLSISFFPSLLQPLPHLAPNLTVSSCVWLGPVLTPLSYITRSWTPSWSQMCYLFMPKNLGLDAVLSRRRGELEKAPTGGQLTGSSIATSQAVFPRTARRPRKGPWGPGGKPEAHTCMLRLLEGPRIPGTGEPGGLPLRGRTESDTTEAT